MVATTFRQPKTYEDYLATPDDGQKYELVDGEIVVCAAPMINHQRLVGRLYRMLAEAADRNGDEAFVSPIAVTLDSINTFEPDVVYRRQESASIVEPRRILGVPSLVVEVLSPGTASRDQICKRAIYESAGVSEYWIVDPVSRTLTALSLRNGNFHVIKPVNSQIASVAVKDFRVDPEALFATLP